MSGENINRIVLTVFAPLLILAGIAGFLIPEQYCLTSGAAPYNLFHIVSGAIGLFIISTGQSRWPSIFNAVFGLVDIYQAVASFFFLWPAQLFYWTWTDDVLHVILGLTLASFGIYGLIGLARNR